jgi:predicted small lipoprotein YifL
LTDFPGRFSALVRALRSPRARVALVALAFVALSGCGKKGPPLAPFSALPAAPGEVTVRRKGDQVEIHFRVPQANSDNRRPAKIDHVEAYGLTMPAEQIETEGEKATGAGKGRHGAKSGGAGGRAGGGMSGGGAGMGGQGSRGAGGGAAGAGPGASAAGPAMGSRDLPIKKYGTVVGSVLVRKPPPKPKEPKDDEPPPPPPPRTDPGLDQGDAAVIIDTLTPESE